MKTLTKVKIINWHYFWNETFYIKPIVFLTGLNGSGKSTLIDALEVVLLGDTSGRSFNKAALDKSTRTLKGYLKGELGDDSESNGFKYLRNGRFSSYIALEFFDDSINDSFTLGIVFDSYEDNSEEHHFFAIDFKLPENEFIVDNVPLSYKGLSLFLLNNYKDKYRFFDTNRQYQDYLKKKLGGLKDKYFSLLKKSTSFSPITDIKTFITEYVCDPQQNLDLSHLQDNIIQYKKLQDESLVIEKRIDRLMEISLLNDEYKLNEENYLLSKYLIERCEVYNSEEKINAFINEVTKSEERIKEIDLELNDFKSNLEELEKRKVKLIQDKMNNDVAKITEELYEQKLDLENKIKLVKEEIIDTNNTIKKYLETYLKEATNVLNEIKKINLDYLDEDKSNRLSKLNLVSEKVISISINMNKKLNEDILFDSDDLDLIKDTFKEFKDLVSYLALSLARNIQSIEQNIKNLKDEESYIKEGSKPFDDRLKEIVASLKLELKNKFKKDISVELYCNLVDIKDNSWANAIEGYLYNQKFNIFVDPKYYLEAYSILKRLLNEYHYYQTALVDSEKVIERAPVMEEDSLAEEISTTHEGARYYTNFFIGKLHKSKDEKEARESLNGITKECDLYRNFTLSKINPRLYQESYIGKNISERFLEEKSKQIKENIENLSFYKSLYGVINEANKLEVLSQGEAAHILKSLLKVSEIKGYENSLEYINNELKDHDTKLLESIDKRINDVSFDISDINANKENLILEKGNLLKQVESLKNDKIVEEKNLLELRKKSLLENYDKDFVENKAEVKFNEKLNENKSYFDILTEANASLSRLQYLYNNVFSMLVKARREYVHDYHLSFDPDSKDNFEFNKELTEFKEVKLPEYKDKIKDSYLKATQQFKDDFIFKLRSAIEEVEEQIEDLNNAIDKSYFGRDHYKFTVKPSPNFKRYYDMFKDDLILESGEDESLFLEKYKDEMEDLFRQIVETNENNINNEELLNNIKTFTDYRSYLEFDLIVKNRESGEEQRLSRTIMKKSGGETQTPFYIAVLASFAQLYHVKDEGEISNTSRIIIFDEAFSKMDRGRINESIKLLRKFNLQVIISCPTDKIPDISPLVDETLVVLHSNNSSYVRNFQKNDI